MTRKTLEFRLRPAVDDDCPFIERLYIGTMEPLLSAFDAWDIKKNMASFKKYYRVSEAKIIVVDDIDAGWFQVHDCPEEISLRQIHIEQKYRSRKIGTKIVKNLIRDATRQGKRLTLLVVKNNPALNLYQRLGFVIAGEDETKFHLSR